MWCKVVSYQGMWDLKVCLVSIDIFEVRLFTVLKYPILGSWVYNLCNPDCESLFYYNCFVCLNQQSIVRVNLRMTIVLNGVSISNSCESQIIHNRVRYFISYFLSLRTKVPLSQGHLSITRQNGA